MNRPPLPYSALVTDEMRDGKVTTSKLRELAIADIFRNMYFDGMQRLSLALLRLKKSRASFAGSHDFRTHGGNT